MWSDDFERSHWLVPRLYNEFYVLEQKLKEFHGKHMYIYIA